MRQLINESCVICRERIGSVVEGHFCPTCGCPVHEGCGRPADGVEGGCPDCGAPAVDAEREQALHQQEQQQSASLLRQQRAFKGMGIFLLVSLYGGARLVIYLAGTPNPTGPGALDAGWALVLGLVGMLSCIVAAVRSVK